MRTLADALGISPTTLYTALRLAVQALMLVRRGKQPLETLADRVRELQNRLAQWVPYPICQSGKNGYNIATDGA